MTKPDKDARPDKRIPLDKLGMLSEEAADVSKVSGLGPEGLEGLPADQKVAVIVKVASKNYRPEDIAPTADISSELFTARLQPDEIRRLLEDALVTKIEISQTLQSLKSD